MRWIFDGHIAGIGTASGLRAVVGLWQESPFGPFADVMVELPSGRRILLAPTAEVAGFIAAIYNFDETNVVDVGLVKVEDGAGGSLTVDAGNLRLRAALGARTALGLAARLIPRPLAVHPAWLRAVNPLAGLLSPGIRTAGTAGGGRREYYGVTDLRRIDAAAVSWDGVDAGPLAAVRPAVQFGFGSVPPQPGIVRVRTTVEGDPVTPR
jgi:hypothetical protein